MSSIDKNHRIGEQKPVVSSRKGPVTQKAFSCHDVIKKVWTVWMFHVMSYWTYRDDVMAWKGLQLYTLETHDVTKT